MIKVVSLFSGGGGLDLGFKQEGYSIIWAIDNNINAVNTYKKNIDERIIYGDINQINLTDIPLADVVIGGPPCQAFSLAGMRNTADPRAKLVWKYLEILTHIKPKAFVFENVVGIMSAKTPSGSFVLDDLKAEFKRIGYNIEVKLINAADYGVPQVRKRVIIVGLKEGNFSFPKPTHSDADPTKLPYVTVDDAIGDLPPLLGENKKTEKDTVTDHVLPTMSELDKYIISYVKPGGNYMDIPKNVPSKRIRRLQEHGGHTTCYGRMRPDKPSYTINTYFNRPNVGCNIHYREDRLISVREAMRLQTFPDWFELVSSSKQGKNLIVGNAVPPLLSRILAKELKKYLEPKIFCNSGGGSMGLSYSDSEVQKFHPLVEESLNRALNNIGKASDYEVLHHQMTGTLEMDFAIRNIHTGKYFCVVEVKRTPSAVNSARYQFQAMSYVQESMPNNEALFYVLTNLEVSIPFRYDQDRPRVIQQMLLPGLSRVVNIQNNSEDIIVNCATDYFSQLLDSFFNGSWQYLNTLDEFHSHMKPLLNQDKNWNTDLAVLLYEYIRGAFTSIGRTNLRNVTAFHNNVQNICASAARINFGDIFTYNPTTFNPTANLPINLLQDLFDFGRNFISGDEVSDVLHSIVSSGHEHEGEVSTDQELADFVALLAKAENGPILQEQNICDPAAGSGSLLSSGAKIFQLQPKQIQANDINKKLLQLLSLRLGLIFPNQVNITNTAQITNANLADLDRDYFENVKVILLNPPFVAGINCGEQKAPFYRAIRQTTHREPLTDIGQMPLEGPFLEYLVEISKENTVIGLVFPVSHLKASGPEAQRIRQLLLNSFGLTTIFTYPKDNLFSHVTKESCILIGRVGHPSENIKVLSSYVNVSDINNNLFLRGLDNLTPIFAEVSPNVIGKVVSRDHLLETVQNGWFDLNDELFRAASFIDQNFNSREGKFHQLSLNNLNIKRGTIGNNGCSDLAYINTTKYNSIDNTCFDQKRGLRNAKTSRLGNKPILDQGDEYFYDVNDFSENETNNLLNEYQQSGNFEGRRQTKKRKTCSEMRNCLNKYANGFSDGNLVAIPRAIRRFGSIYALTGKYYISTNFVVINLENAEEQKLITSWMTTIFYQLICEVLAKGQEGCRKLEVDGILKTLIPNVNNIQPEQKSQIINELENIEFLDLVNPSIRQNDILWANILFPNNSEDVLNNALELLTLLVAKRNP